MNPELKITSGSPYSLAQLFSGEKKFVIPDLQREYCWGDKLTINANEGELVMNFYDTIDSSHHDSKLENIDLKIIQLGMIYAYQFPENHIQLCDGQQRLTTLYLLIGLLYQKTKNARLKDFLISNFEYENDDKQPRLQYAIRESTLYFLSDLVCEFFLSDLHQGVKDIKLSSWYFMDYDLDPTIQSMIRAMMILEEKLKQKDEALDFSNYILDCIHFFYFDMKDREHGEDMFVVINTTGEPLTPTENLKPILLGKIDNIKERSDQSDIWEKWEKWFWQNKGKKEYEADQGLNQFFVWYWQIFLKQEKQWKDKKSFEINPIALFTKVPENTNNEEENTEIGKDQWERRKSIYEVDKFFKAYIELVELVKKDGELQKIFHSVKSVQVFDAEYFRTLSISILLPLISFKVKFLETDIHSFLRRLRKNYFDGQIKERNHNFIDWRHILEIIEKSENETSVLRFSAVGNTDFKKIPNVVARLENWYNSEERMKEKLRIEYNDKISCWEDLPEFYGDLSPLLRMVMVFNGQIKLEDENDLDAIDLNYVDSLTFSNVENAYNLWHKLYNSENVELRNRFNLLHFRFSRNDAWSGYYTFGRKHMNYFRQGYKAKAIFYQNWFYVLVFNIYDKNDIEIIEYLKDCSKNILSQFYQLSGPNYSPNFFNSSLSKFQSEFSISSFLNDFKRVDVEQLNVRKNYFDWLSYISYYWFMLELTSKSDFIDPINEEIVFDTHIQNEKDHRYSSLGSQFLRPWTKATTRIPKFKKLHNETSEEWAWVEKNDVKAKDYLVKEFL